VALARQDLGDFPNFLSSSLPSQRLRFSGLGGFYETYYSPDRTMEYFAMARS